MAQEVLSALAKGTEPWPNSWKLAQELGLKHDEVVGALKSLEAREYVALEQLRESRFELSAEAARYATEGTPDYRLFSALLARGGRAERAELEQELGAAFKSGLQSGAKRFFTVDKSCLQVLPGLELGEDSDAVLLAQLGRSAFFTGDFTELAAREEVKRLQRRKLFEVKTLNYYQPRRGARFAPTLAVQRADLTAEDLATEAWRDAAQFKSMNLAALGRETAAGGLHPLMKVRSAFRQILLEMGFEEMRTDRFVENSFWNFDALFQPQQHPARDAQDTFFLRTPAATEFVDEELKAYVAAVGEVHERGCANELGESTGWGYAWSGAEARKNVLRTHTTAISSRYLWQMAQELKRTGVFRPRKLFSIDRVYRNEALDATHLAEFHQVEGLIVGRKLGLPHLKSFIRQFYAKIGITQVRFKPAYNPYTEPSMEIFCFHPTLQRNVEIGNSGVFRPEMLAPMGWPADVSVIAWGLSLERPAMIQLGCANIRELSGHRVPVKNVREAPVVTL